MRNSMENWLHRAAAALVGFLIYATPAGAQVVDRTESASGSIAGKVAFDLYAGHLSGKSGEFVYDAATGKKISQLDWRIKHMGVIGGNLTARPLDWLSLRIGGWVPFASQNVMDDYDWLVPSTQEWSHWSHHPDTPLGHASMLDARVAVRAASFKRGALHLMGGYRRLNIGWTANDGEYIYSSPGNFRDQTGSLSDGPGIAYQQWFETPYLGLGANYDRGRWSLEGEVIGSLWARARDRDLHHNRSLLFHDQADSVDMLGASLKAGYAVSERFALTARVEYQRYFEGKGPSSIEDMETGDSSYLPGEAAGIAHESVLVGLGATFTFQ